MMDGDTGSSAHAVIELIQREYTRTRAGGMSQLVERELRVPVTETERHTYRFSGFHYIDVSIDDYLEGIPVSFSVTVAESCHGGYEALLVCQTNLDEPEYAYWEFRDYLKQLAGGDSIGSFRMHESGLSEADCSDCLRYEYKFPIPEDGNVSQGVIECVVSRFLNDVSHAATAYFELFFYPILSHSHTDRLGAAPGVQRTGCVSSAKVIPFPLNRRNKSQ
jgi:hypothetical protein